MGRGGDPWAQFQDAPAAAAADPWADFADAPGQADPFTADPNSTAKRYLPTEGMTGVEKFAAGAGKAFSDIARGTQQATGDARDALASRPALMGALPPQIQPIIALMSAMRNPKKAQQLRAAADEAKRLDAPLMDTGAGMAGNIAGNVALAAPTAAIPGVNTYTGAGLLGATLGALQPVASDDSRTMNAAKGAAGGVAGRALSGILSSVARGARPATAQSQSGAMAQTGPSSAGAGTTAEGSVNVSVKGGGPSFGTVGDDVSAGLTRAQAAAAEAGQRLGMRMTPGQATGSKALQQLEAKMESQPWTSGPFNATKANNQAALNRATAAAIGETDDVVDSTVLARANERLGQVFEDVRDDAARQVDPAEFVSRMKAINDEFDGLLPRGETVAAHPLVKKLMTFAEAGNPTGKQLGSLTSKLGRAAHKEMTGPSGDRDLGLALYQVKEYVDDLVEQGLSAERLATYQAARGQYRNLLNITKTGVLNPSTGNVNGITLSNVLQKADKHGFLFGGNKTDMYAAARFAQAFKPIVGDSGTATRSVLNSIPELVVGVPMKLAANAYASQGGTRAIAGSMAAARAARRASAPFLRRAAPYAVPISASLGANAEIE